MTSGLTTLRVARVAVYSSYGSDSRFSMRAQDGLVRLEGMAPRLGP